MRVAVVQMAPKFKAFEANSTLIEALTVEAIKHGAELICFPELAFTGYSFMSYEEAEPFAEVLDGSGKAMRILLKHAAQSQVAIVCGMVAKDIGTRNLYNAQVLVTPDSRWVWYAKLNFFGNDWLWATEGQTSPPITEVFGKRVGLLICADIRDKSDKLDDFYEIGDTDVVVLSAAWGRGSFPAGKWVQFARENKVFLCASNRYGQEENNDFGAGGIGVIEPSGKVHCQGLRWSEPCIVYADIP